MKRSLLAATIVGLVIGAGAASAPGANIDPHDTGASFAYGENVGWINFQPAGGGGVTVTDTGLTGFAWGTSIGWIDLGPASGGVLNDTAGRLSGFAWGENVGWIDFAPDGGGVTTAWKAPDRRAPLVTPPAGVTVRATEVGGARGSASPALAAFLSGGSAIDVGDPSPARLSPLIGTVNADDTLLVPLGASTVTFRFRDASGNVGSATSLVTVLVASDVAVTRTEIAGPLRAGQSVSYTLTVRNHGPHDAGGVTLTDTLTGATDVTFVSADGAACSPAGRTITCDLATVAAGAVVPVTITMVPRGAGTLTARAAVTGDADPNGANDAASTAPIPVVAGNIDPAGTGASLAWAENVGWINFKPAFGPGVTVAETAVTGFAWGENIGWINLSPTPGGVVNDGSGRLSGRAYGENVGWIDFAPEGGGVTIDEATGNFLGSAWGENVGWIDFAPSSGGVTTSWRPDRIPPAVTPPPGITVFATEAAGARGTASPALAGFLAGGSAVDAVDPAPARLPPQVGGVDVDDQTVFAVGTTDVTFRFRDATGNVGAATASVTVVPEADLVLAVTGTPDPAAFGQRVTYTITLTNRGPSPATDVVLTDQLPDQATFVSATAPCTLGDGPAVTCGLGTLAGDASVSLTIVATPAVTAEPVTVTSTASVVSTTADPDAGNNTATVSTRVEQGADVSVTARVSPTETSVGLGVTYTFTVTNAGPAAALGVRLTDPLPPSLTLVSAAASQGTCTGAATVTCDLASMDGGASATVTIVATPASPGTPSSTVTVTASTADPDSANNAATVSLVVDAVRIWRGGAPAGPSDWSIETNWLPIGVPSGAVAVLIPASAAQPPVLDANVSVRDLILEPGATLATSRFAQSFTLSVSRYPDNRGTITGSGTVALTGAGATLQGTFPNVSIAGVASAAGATTINGSLTISGEFAVNGRTVSVTGNLRTTGSIGILTMTNVADQLVVGGSATFDASGSTDGKLTAGVLRVAGNFAHVRCGCGSARNFAASGSHTVVFDGAAAQTVSVNDSGPTISRFQHVRVANAAGVNFTPPANTIFVNGNLTVDPGARMGGTAAVTVAGGLIAAAGSTVTTTVINVGGLLSVAGAGFSPGTLGMIGTGTQITTPTAFTGTFRVDGNLTLGAALTVTGNLLVRGNLTLGGQTVTVSGNLTTNDPTGTLTMTDPADLLVVAGSATFDANGSTDGKLTAGVLRVGGNFTQPRCGCGSNRNFAASGSHTVVFDGAAAQTVSVNDSGSTISRFQHVRVANAAGVNFNPPATTIFLNGDLTVDPGARMGGTAAVTVAGGLIAAAGSTVTTTVINVGGLLSVAGSGFSPGTLSMTGTGTQITTPTAFTGTFRVDGNLTLGAPLTVTGNLLVRGNLTLGGQTVTVSGNLTTNDPTGTLTMTDPADLLVVAGSATFDASGSTDGKLTAGVLRVGGNFTQLRCACGSNRNFAASGSHTVVFDGAAPQSVSVRDSGPTISRFQHVRVVNAAGVNFTSGAIFLNGNLAVDPGARTGGTAAVIVGGNLTAGGGATITTSGLTVSGVDVNGLVLDNVAFTITGGTIARFDDVTFQNYAVTATQLTINHPGAPTPFRFRGVRFLVTPTSGFFVRATDTAGDGNVLTIDLPASEPTDGSARTATAGGAIVRWSSSVPTADVSVALSGPVEPVLADVPFSYTATVANVGPATATGIVLAQSLPAELTVQEVTPSQGTCGGAGPVNCSLGALASGASATVRVLVLPTAAAALEATASVVALEYDPDGANNTASVVTTVRPNRGPVARPLRVTTVEGTPVGIVLGGRDPEGETLTFRVTKGPAQGTLSGTAPDLTYTPAPGFVGLDRFAFTASDGHRTSRPATVTITVSPQDRPFFDPIPDQTVAEDAARQRVFITGILPAPAPGRLRVSMQATSSNPALVPHPSIIGTGATRTLAWEPRARLSGTATITVVARDTRSARSTFSRTFRITVTAVPDAPKAAGQTVTTLSGTAVGIALRGSDDDGDPLKFTVVTPPAHGTLSGTAPNLVYRPEPGFVGRDGFGFRADDGRLVSAPATVSIAVLPGLTFRYTPDVTVALGDVTVGSAAVVQEDLAGTVRLVEVGAAPPGARVDAYHVLPNGDQLLSFDVTVTLPGDLTARPADVVRFDGAAWSLFFDGAARGVPDGANVESVAMSGSNLLLSFDVTVALPDGVVAGPLDVVRFDGTTWSRFFDGAGSGVPAGLRIDAADYLEAVDLLLLSFDGAGVVGGVAFDKGDVLEVHRATGGWALRRRVPAQHPGWAGASLAALAVDAAPLAAGDRYRVAEDGSLIVGPRAGVLRNDRDAGASSLTAVLVDGPAHGTLALDPDGSFRYTPEADFHGTDTFTYRARDGVGDGNAATVRITVTPVDDAPIANAQSVTARMNTPLAIRLTGSDADGDPLTFTVTAPPGHGTLTGSGPDLTYSPGAGFVGTDGFAFTVRDRRRTSAPATVSIDVQPVPTLRYSADATIAAGALTAGGADVLQETPSGTVTLVDTLAVPPGVNLDAYHVLPNGDRLVSFDVTVALSEDVTAGPADVVRFDGQSYTVVFSGAANAIPSGVNVDAVAMAGADLLLSFDVTVSLPGGVTAGPADLVRFDGTTFSLFFDARTAEVPAGLDVDAAHYLESANLLLLSFDGSGTVGGVSFDRNDVLAHDPATGRWTLVDRGAGRQAGWAGANLDALWATLSAAGGPL